MSQEIHNFARFFKLLAMMPGHMDRDELKESLVLQHTGGRTDSLREMTRKEYDACCNALEEATDYKLHLRRERSIVLKQMQMLGINTVIWDRVDAFCKDPRIAGKPFAFLSIEELEALGVKLRAIERKGGLKPATCTAGTRTIGINEAELN